MLWHVTVDMTTDNIGRTIEAVVLAHTERSAKVLAARTIARTFHGEAHATEARRLDIQKTGVVFAMGGGEFTPLISREEAAVGQW